VTSTSIARWIPTITVVGVLLIALRVFGVL